MNLTTTNATANPIFKGPRTRTLPRTTLQPLAFTDQILANGSFAEKRMLLLSGAVSSSVSSVAPAQDQPPPHGTAPPPAMGASSSSMMGIVFSVEALPSVRLCRVPSIRKYGYTESTRAWDSTEAPGSRAPKPTRDPPRDN